MHTDKCRFVAFDPFTSNSLSMVAVAIFVAKAFWALGGMPLFRVSSGTYPYTGDRVDSAEKLRSILTSQRQHWIVPERRAGDKYNLLAMDRTSGMWLFEARNFGKPQETPRSLSCREIFGKEQELLPVTWRVF